MRSTLANGKRHRGPYKVRPIFSSMSPGLISAMAAIVRISNNFNRGKPATNCPLAKIVAHFGHAALAVFQTNGVIITIPERGRPQRGQGGLAMNARHSTDAT